MRPRISISHCVCRSVCLSVCLLVRSSKNKNCFYTNEIIERRLIELEAIFLVRLKVSCSLIPKRRASFDSEVDMGQFRFPIPKRSGTDLAWLQVHFIVGHPWNKMRFFMEENG